MEDLHVSPTSETLSSPDSNSHYYEKVLIKGKKTFKCLADGCGKTFRFKSDMERHIVIHAKTRPYACAHPSCGKTFKRPDALKSHMQIHNEDIEYACPVPGCNAVFQKKSALQYHVIKHQKPDHFICSFQGCHETFVSYGDLKIHQKKNCSGAPKKSTSQSKPDEENPFLELSEDSHHGFESFSFEEEPEEFDPLPTKLLHTESSKSEPLRKKESIELSDKSVKERALSLLQGECKELTAECFMHNICKQLMQENEQLKKELDDKMTSISSKFGTDNRVDFLLNQALDLQVEDVGTTYSP